MRKAAVLLLIVVFTACQVVTGTTGQSPPSLAAMVSVENFDSIHGAGTIRVMVIRNDGNPAYGETIVKLSSPCQPQFILVDIIVDYSQIQPGQTEDGAFFDFILPDSSCHARYFVTAKIFDSSNFFEGGTTFKY